MLRLRPASNPTIVDQPQFKPKAPVLFVLDALPQAQTLLTHHSTVSRRLAISRCVASSQPGPKVPLRLPILRRQRWRRLRTGVREKDGEGVLIEIRRSQILSLAAPWSQSRSDGWTLGLLAD